MLAADRKKTQRKRPDMEMETGGADGEQHGSKFPCDHTGCRDGDRQLPAVLKEQKGEDPDASHTDKLFKKLRRGRDGGFPKAVKISVDTGMDGGKRKRQGSDAQKRRAARFKKQAPRNKAGAIPYACRAQAGGGQGKEQPYEKDADPSGASARRILAGCAAPGGEPGDGVLDPGRAEGKHQGDYGADELIDPDIFLTEQAGKKDPVKKTDQAADQPCDGQDKGTGDKGILQPFCYGRREKAGFGRIQHDITGNRFLVNICSGGG